MKKVLLSLVILITAIFAFDSCKNGIEKGDTIKLNDDIPGATTIAYADKIDKCIQSKEYEDAMRMYYLGYAIMLENGKNVTVTDISGDFFEVEYEVNHDKYWVKELYLKRAKR